MDVNELFNLIREGEGERAEFKVTFPEQAHDLAKDMVAFANSGGGIVLLGVSDDGEPVGITEPNKAVERLANIARSCSPPLCPEIKKVNVWRDVHLVYASVPLSFPCLCNGRIYIRVGSCSVPIKEGEELRRLFRQRQKSQEEEFTLSGPDIGDDVENLLEVGEAEESLSTDALVSDLMTPRSRIIAVPVTMTVQQAYKSMIESKYSRLLVYHGDLDTIEGFIHASDLLRCFHEAKENTTIGPFLRPLYFVAEGKNALDLLKEMHASKLDLAIAIDETGAVTGLVTAEDILDTILGEIVPLEDGWYYVRGGTPKPTIEKLFNIDFEDEDFTTIAGLVIAEKGNLPRVGERLNLHGIDVEVSRVTGNRILRLRLRRARKSDSEAPMK